MAMIAAPVTACTGLPADLEGLTAAALPGETVVSGSPAEVYTRVARGMLRCWFGPDMVLRGRYAFTAKADATPGGRAEIKIHEKEHDGRRGLRAFEVRMAPRGDQTVVSAANVRFPAGTGEQMRASVARWAGDNPSCAAGSGDWQDSWEPVHIKSRSRSRSRGKS